MLKQGIVKLALYQHIPTYISCDPLHAWAVGGLQVLCMWGLYTDEGYYFSITHD